MFTGIVTGIGRIAAVRALGTDASHGKRLVVAAPPGWLEGTRAGDSIALNGACMTVTSLDADSFSVDISAESLACTAGLDSVGVRVNLEQALRANHHLGGHLVSGHVDGVGTVTHMASTGESIEMRITAPRELERFLAVKGSLAVNGVSLTVNRVVDLREGCEVSINLIPHTAANTTLGTLAAGSKVNLEIDLIARYVERMMRAE